MITGIGVFFSSFWVWALNALQNSMMFRPRSPTAGPIGGDGFAAPAGTCNFRYPVTFFAIYVSCLAGLATRGFRFVVRIGSGCLPAPLLPRPLPREACFARLRSDLLDLTEFQFDRRGAAEDRHRNLHARTRLVDFLHHARERCEGAVGHAHILANLKRHRGL